MNFRVLYPALLSILLLLASCDSKVTDPSDPRFDPAQFDFNDYQNYDDLSAVFRSVLTPGVHKEDVDALLVAAGKGTSRKLDADTTFGFGANIDSMLANTLRLSPSGTVMLYHKKMSRTYVPNSWKILVVYDEHMRLINIIGYNDFVFPVHLNQDGEKK